MIVRDVAFWRTEGSAKAGGTDGFVSGWIADAGPSFVIFQNGRHEKGSCGGEFILEGVWEYA